MDRLGRNMLDLLQTIKSLNDRGVAVQFMKEHLTFSGEDSPMSKLPLAGGASNDRKFNPALFAPLADGDGLALIQRCRALR